MTRAEFQELLDDLKARLEEVGLPELADDENYLRGEGPDARLPNPRDQLLETLQAFERELALRDRRTVIEAIDRLAESLDGPPPRAVRVVRAPREDGPSTPTYENLFDAPELSELRLEVDQLIAELRETPLER
jgi:hypothetical protein